MAEPIILSENQKTRLHLAIILKAHNYDIYHAANEVMRLLNLEEDKRHSVYSLMSKISFCLRKTVEQIGFKGIANIAWKIYNEESIPTLSNIVSPEKSTFLAHQLKMGKGKWRDLKYYLQ
ncbi:hypothetical protein LOD99_4054 [Oopsacas minuta]|uniref:Uncharacterized protein n=1 Tax=Oopsacas minuta TaxID=111878 RepID=A0AAV7JVY4_9METZ|nr:hypothetical protein LOD99_4054 [Oopsacas minuta]